MAVGSFVNYPRFKGFIPGSNNIAAGYKLQSFLAGTSTPSALYTDQTLGTPAANPFTLDADGEATLFGNPAIAYKLQYQTPAGTPIWTIDNVYFPQAGVATVTSEWVQTTLTPTFISGTSCSVVGDQRATFTLGRRIRTSNIAGFQYGTVITASFGAGITTLTVVNDQGSNPFDAGLSIISYGIMDAPTLSRPYTTDFVTPNNANVNLVSAGTVILTPSAGVALNDRLVEYSNDANGRFVAKYAGVYELTSIGWVYGNGANVTAVGAYSVGWYKNTVLQTNVVNFDWPFGTGVNSKYCPWSSIPVYAALSAGDNIDFRIQCNPTFTGGPMQSISAMKIRRLM